MLIVINATEEQKKELLIKPVPDAIALRWWRKGDAVEAADAYFDLQFEDGEPAFTGVDEKPVFVHAVLTLSEKLPANFIRINAWKGFLQRAVMEIAGREQALEKAAAVLYALQWKYQVVPDTPGMVAARVIAMIINEAYFGLGEELSSKQDIDTAMKLGTNYPYGPFEWSEQIGLQKIHALLTRLNKSDTRYEVAPALSEDLFKNQ
ncbi:3-hydroxyacyl-CoA dehydrogenase family protein [Sediminibacterium soli]|uniref:3-hydroxyacyl-CoA dehydrogenase family protein n=1 Tax=Sediminibacterium soli TaxID=2698829 RepID=UPI00137A710E|nr:3-hydroxyacyl-CoA dehydrogenase family protein [Sediminibacterium soli]NCI47630.1 hypothetical protein [Sediminibacterium soli]